MTAVIDTPHETPQPSDPAKPHVRLTWAERLESLKAGGIGGLAAAVAVAVIALFNQSGLATWLVPLVGRPPSDWAIAWLIRGAIAVLSGFLFGVTYRYVIRYDQNPHLKSGAVLAFGLVRGGAQIEVGLQAQSPLVGLAVMVGESWLLFAVARFLLDSAIAQGWLKPFPLD